MAVLYGADIKLQKLTANIHFAFHGGYVFYATINFSFYFEWTAIIFSQIEFGQIERCGV